MALRTTIGALEMRPKARTQHYIVVRGAARWGVVRIFLAGYQFQVK